MMRVFADTFYFVAMLNPRDRAHTNAVEWAQRTSASLVTTQFVLIEVADTLHTPESRMHVCDLIDRLAADPDVIVVPLSMELFSEGMELFRHRPDKSWSLTDCTSFVVMEREGITDALTGDHHFEQAGFVALFK